MNYSSVCMVTTEDNRTYLVEPFVESKEFTKFTSDGDLKRSAQLNEEERMLIDFSHWTHQRTNGHLMVVDLQGFRLGNQFYLTDPWIYSSKNQFGQNDSGSKGFESFLQSHKNNCCLNG